MDSDEALRGDIDANRGDEQSMGARDTAPGVDGAPGLRHRHASKAPAGLSEVQVGEDGVSPEKDTAGDAGEEVVWGKTPSGQGRPPW